MALQLDPDVRATEQADDLIDEPANAVLINFLWIAAYGLDGFANATEALVGEAIGAGRLAGRWRSRPSGRPRTSAACVPPLREAMPHGV